MTAESEENLQEQLSKFQTCKVFLFKMNVVRLNQTVLSWVAFMIHPFTCALVCPNHLFFCKNSFVKTYSSIIMKGNYIRYPWRIHHKAL